MAAYVEQATYVGDLGSICGIIRTDGIVSHTVKDLPVPAAANLFPKASDATNNNLLTYSGVQARVLAIDVIKAVILATARDRSVQHRIT